MTFFTTWEQAWNLFILAYFAAVNDPQIWFFPELSSQNTAFLYYIVHEERLSTDVPKTQTQNIKKLFSVLTSLFEALGSYYQEPGTGYVLTHITSSRLDYPEEEETPT